MPIRSRRLAGTGPERALASSRARDAFFSSLSRELRCSLDEEGRFLFVEGAWQAVLGWQPEELRRWHWEEIVHPADRIRVRKVLDRLRAGGGCERNLEMRLAGPTGGHRLLSWTMIAGPGPDCIIGLGHDRTDEQRQQLRGRRSVGRLERRNEELEARVAELEDRYTAVENFAGMAAHQLSEPLVIAESSAFLVAEELGDDLDPLLRGRLDAIERGAQRGRQLVDALLHDARTHGHAVELEAVDVGHVVGLTLAALRPRLEERSVLPVVGPLPSLQAEPRLLQIIFENLVSNALKYGPGDSAHINISAEREADGWRLSVTSDGTPIAASEARRIFEPFRRIPGERRATGSGLGLAICARLVERFGGRIGVDPGESVGNTFWFVLPDSR